MPPPSFINIPVYIKNDKSEETTQVIERINPVFIQSYFPYVVDKKETTIIFIGGMQRRAELSIEEFEGIFEEYKNQLRANSIL